MLCESVKIVPTCPIFTGTVTLSGLEVQPPTTDMRDFEYLMVQNSNTFFCNILWINLYIKLKRRLYLYTISRGICRNFGKGVSTTAK